MGLPPCHLSCRTENESQSPSQSHSNHLLSETSLSSSFSSEPSLPSVPSFTSPSQPDKHHPATHHKCVATLKGHSSSVFTLALAGELLYSGASNSEIRGWSQDSSGSIHDSTDNVVATGNGAVKSLVISGDKLFSSHQDNKIRVWKIDQKESLCQKYKCIATLPTLNDRFLRCFSANNYVEVRRHKKSTWVHHVDTVSALAVSKDGSLLYSASWDRTFKIWRTSDFRCLESVERAHDDALNAIEVSKDGFVYTGSADKKIKVWKNHAGRKNHSLVATLEKHKCAVNALALSTDGRVLYSGACDRSILVWERESSGASDGGGGGSDRHMVLVGALRGHTKAILCLAAVTDHLVCSGSADETVRIWRRGIDKSYTCLAVLEGHLKPVKCLTAVVDSRGASDSSTSYLVYSGSLDCDIKVWQLCDAFIL